MRALGEREFELHRQVLRHGDPLDRVQRLRARLADHQPPIRHLLDREVRRDDILVVVSRVLIRVVLRERDRDVDRRPCGVVALGEFVIDVESGVGIDESRNVPPRIKKLAELSMIIVS